MYLQNIQTLCKVNTHIPQLVRFLWGVDDKPAEIIIDIDFAQDNVDTEKVIKAIHVTWNKYQFDTEGMAKLRERCEKVLEMLDLI